MLKQKCSSCGQIYSITREFFGNTPSGGFRRKCRKCVAANTKKHYEKSPEKVFQRVSKYKEQKIKAGGNYSEEDIKNIRAKLNDQCRYCGIELKNNGEIEHMIPISRGGNNSTANITLACFQCNKEKHGKTLDEYISWRKERGLKNRII